MVHYDSQIFWSNMDKIQELLLMGDSEFSDYFELEASELQNIRYKNKVLVPDMLEELASKMNFKVDAVYSTDFNPEYSPHENLPLLSRYNTATYSQTRPLMNVFNYVEMKSGTKAKVELLRKFQLSENFINNADNRANLLLITDIIRHLHENAGYTNQDFLNIGRRLPFLSSSRPLKEKLSVHKTAGEILECFIYDLARLFDTNYTYRINGMNEEMAIIEAIPNKHVIDELKIDVGSFGSEEICYTRMGNISASLFFRYGRNAGIKKIESAHKGASSNKYLLDLSPFKKMDKVKGLESAAGIFYTPARTSLEIFH